MTRPPPLLAIALLFGLLAPGAASGQTVAAALRAPIAAAAQRFGLPPDLIAEVITVESNGERLARSPAGAMGLMQLMPATWAALRERLGLGLDPYDASDNILAGAAYLREMLDRYGTPGALAAYNAGPGRYEQSLVGRPLPLETQRYVARLSARTRELALKPSWQASSLFPSTPNPWPRAQDTLVGQAVGARGGAATIAASTAPGSGQAAGLWP